MLKYNHVWVFPCFTPKHLVILSCLRIVLSEVQADRAFFLFKLIYIFIFVYIMLITKELRKMNIVIIGYSVAAATASKRLLKEGHNVTIISGEGDAPYYRARILELLENKSLSDIAIAKDNSVVINKKAVKIDREKHQVILDDGSSVEYEKLILAVGSNANRLNVNSDKVIAIRSVSDVKKLQEMLKGASSVAVLGGGLLGLEAAVKIHDASGIRVSVIDRSSWVLSRQFLQPEGELLSEKLSALGIDVITKAGDVKVEDGVKITLADGRTLQCDILVTSIGVKPETKLALDCGLNVNRGIVVDDTLKTNDDDIYAIGDCAEVEGKTPCMVSAALDMARCVLAENKRYKTATPSAILKIASLEAVSMGSVNENCVRHVVETPTSREVFYLDGDVLSAYYAVGTSKNMVNAKMALSKPLTDKQKSDFAII